MAWAIIATLDSPTAGAFDFPSLTLAGYKVLRIHLSAITVTTDGTDPRLTFYVSGSEVTTGYRWITRSVSTSGTGDSASDGAASQILLVASTANFDVGNAATESFSGTVTVNSPVNTSLYKAVHAETFGIGPTGNAIHTSAMGVMDNTGAIDGLKIGGTSNLTAGKVRVLGLV